MLSKSKLQTIILPMWTELGRTEIRISRRGWLMLDVIRHLASATLVFEST